MQNFASLSDLAILLQQKLQPVRGPTNERSRGPVSAE